MQNADLSASNMRSLPDPDISLRDAADFILDSALGRRALGWNTQTGFPTSLRDLIGHIYRLTQSCHMAEFTDHGLSHLCSLVDRISRWTCPPQSGISVQLVEGLSPEEAAILLVATLAHDIGMLSQRAEDLPADDTQHTAKALSNLSNWVRRTHIARLSSLVTRLFAGSPHADLLKNQALQRALAVAKAHGVWPWENGFAALPNKDAGLAAVVAVADLLDEDALRCDTTTLLAHRRGTTTNMAHWIRHTLTANRVLVENGCVEVKLVRPPGTNGLFAPFFSALRNHYRLILLYQEALSRISATILQIEFSPLTGVPTNEAAALARWNFVPEFTTPQALLFHLLQTFMPLALQDIPRVSADALARTKSLNMENIDLQWMHQCMGTVEARSPYEQAFRAVLANESRETT